MSRLLLILPSSICLQPPLGGRGTTKGMVVFLSTPQLWAFSFSHKGSCLSRVASLRFPVPDGSMVFLFLLGFLMYEFYVFLLPSIIRRRSSCQSGMAIFPRTFFFFIFTEVSPPPPFLNRLLLVPKFFLFFFSPPPVFFFFLFFFFFFFFLGSGAPPFLVTNWGPIFFSSKVCLGLLLARRDDSLGMCLSAAAPFSKICFLE